jgi:DNA-binding NarL/FixJ family response regulator
MIVDDLKRTRDSLAALLLTWEQVGEIREAANGLEAIGLAQVFQPDLVIMDVRMLKLDGIDATRIIKQNTPEVKVVVMSMYPEYDDKAMLANADAFISKGETPERLLAIIQLLLIGVGKDDKGEV